MKQLQLGIAFAVLVVMVFVITFAMNYLGGTVQAPVEPDAVQPARDVVFLQKLFPPDGRSALESEHLSTGFVDFPFYNPHAEAVKIGLDRKSCRCAGVEIYVLPEDNRRYLIPWAIALAGNAGPGPLLTVAPSAQVLPVLEKGASGVEILEKTDSAVVPGKSLGWARLRYKGERTGVQTLGAQLWMDSAQGGQIASLELRIAYHEPLRVEPTLDFGVLRDEELQRGATRNIMVWSPIRPELRLQATSAYVSGGAGQDTFAIGVPQPINPADLPTTYSGPVKCAYRIPVTLLARSPDGKVATDVGPFRRWITLSSPDVPGETRSVAVIGRVRGVVEIGGDDEINEINFTVFPRSRGKRETIQLYSEQADLKLTFDRQRTPEFLSATLIEQKSPDNRRTWQLRAEVLPDKASGPFPRKADPAFRDSAIYLNAQIPGKPPRSIRIAAVGTASAG